MSEQKSDAAKLFKDKTLPKVSEEHKQSCETQITLKEIGVVLTE